jgi:hypothetical protein
MGKILFQEKQKFTQWWLWLILLVPTFYILYKLLGPLFEGQAAQHSGNYSLSLAMSTGSWLALLILVLILSFMFFMTMRTAVDIKKIGVRHLYFIKEEWYWSDIESAEIIEYGFVGYGIRISINHGNVYNVKGNKGLLITLKNGKKRLIGTQKPEELSKISQLVLR